MIKDWILSSWELRGDFPRCEVFWLGFVIVWLEWWWLRILTPQDAKIFIDGHYKHGKFDGFFLYSLGCDARKRFEYFVLYFRYGFLHRRMSKVSRDVFFWFGKYP
ncbi:uncharacterized protein LY89DRAFT_398907 [Mollisia scopiformis]|uniref:Uncharacterized protein n=1 Tax=Mollisia scopiformis TaxID=149040 RepID=A0A132B372_MOLSC|nr:uncharacterized protein LY89DRAFT_398907 [Mollisia scopiformis]KUJ06842.1 hypothetical protein LY89DRAFT_398907 [Mollisia scopiformis]